MRGIRRGWSGPGAWVAVVLVVLALEVGCLQNLTLRSSPELG